MASVVERTCGTCSPSYFDCIKCFHNDDNAALKFLQDHGIILATDEGEIPTCPNCDSKLNFDENRKALRCFRKYKDKTSKRTKRCDFYVSIFNGSFLSGSHLRPSQILLFVCSWLQKNWCHETVLQNLEMDRRSSTDWRSFCSEVTEFWFDNQERIGGVDVSVEIDETLITKRKYNRGRALQQVWLFGGIERISKKRFIVPLIDGEIKPIPRNKETLISLIKKFIRPGSTIYSDLWKAYDTLHDEGYVHFRVNHSLNFVDPDNCAVHTQNIERLWRDVKENIKRPGIRTEYIKQYLGRYLFLKENGFNAVHEFLGEAKKLYPPSLVSKERRNVRPSPIPAIEGEYDDDSGDVEN